MLWRLARAAFLPGGGPEAGAHCYCPCECNFVPFCKSQELRAECPVEWLPRLQTKAVKKFIKTRGITDLRDVPSKYLNHIQRRVKAQTFSGQPFFDHSAAATELAEYELPARFLDFETVYFAVPIWKGTRPYQHIPPYQFSRHELSPTGELDHSEFLDLSDDDPPSRFAEALIAACGQAGPVFVYKAAFEAARITELADRFPQLRRPLLAVDERIVGLLPVARSYYYHLAQHGSWALKSVLLYYLYRHSLRQA